jgi:hypothetical protein
MPPSYQNGDTLAHTLAQQKTLRRAPWMTMITNTIIVTNNNNDNNNNNTNSHCTNNNDNTMILQKNIWLRLEASMHKLPVRGSAKRSFCSVHEGKKHGKKSVGTNQAKID